MSRLRPVLITFALPMVYVAALYLATRPSKPVYALGAPTVMTVTEKPGPAILHAPEVVYPPQAVRDRVEGSVILKVTVPVSGPARLRQAAIDNARQWQFEAKAQET